MVKASYRKGAIDTATAEAFAAVPEDRQEEVWKELDGRPRHAEQVRNIIAAAWIDSAHALFDLSTLPESAVSQDLFHERTLIERSAFLAAQTEALAAQRDTLIEDGWSEAAVAREEDVRDRLYAMIPAEQTLDDKAERRLAKLQAVREKLEAKVDQIDDADEAALEAIGEKLDALADKEREIIDHAPENYSEATKAVGTAFLLLQPDGQVLREFRVPRTRRQADPSSNGDGHEAHADAKPPTSDELSDRQKAETFHRRTLAVRAALLENAAARKRLLLLILHDRIRSEALSVRHEANATTLHATHGEGFTCEAWDKLNEKRSTLDPFKDGHFIEDVPAYDRLMELSDSQVNQLTALLAVEHLTAHPLRATKLVDRLAAELSVDFRKSWRPDAAWLNGYRKCQLAHLMAELRGPVYSPAHETRKKSELVEALATLFADAAEGKLDDPKLAERVNRWLPANLREAGDPPR